MMHTCWPKGGGSTSRRSNRIGCGTGILVSVHQWRNSFILKRGDDYELDQTGINHLVSPESFSATVAQGLRLDWQKCFLFHGGYPLIHRLNFAGLTPAALGMVAGQRP